MNKREALIALANGKKIRLKNWEEGRYVYLDCDDDLVDEDDDYNVTGLNNNGIWEIYEEDSDKSSQTGFDASNFKFKPSECSILKCFQDGKIVWKIYKNGNKIDETITYLSIDNE